MFRRVQSSNTLISLGVTEFVEFHRIKGCVQMAILEKNFEPI